MSDQEKSFLVGFVFILLGVCAILGLYFVRYSGDQMADKITAVASVFSVLVSGVAIFYVYKTYQSQSEQNKRLKKDVEFNRALDILYKQLDHSNKFIVESGLFSRLETIEKRINISKYNKNISELDNNGLLSNLKHIYNDLKIFNGMLNVYRRIIDVETIGASEYIILKDIVKSNLNRKFLDVIIAVQERLYFVQRNKTMKEYMDLVEEFRLIYISTMEIARKIDEFFDNNMEL